MMNILTHNMQTRGFLCVIFCFHKRNRHLIFFFGCIVGQADEGGIRGSEGVAQGAAGVTERESPVMWGVALACSEPGVCCRGGWREPPLRGAALVWCGVCGLVAALAGAACR